MQRAERLFQLLTLLRNRRTVMTARQMADHLLVSERTIYRDMQSLSLSGVPIEGEAGVGYRLSHRYQLPPLMFDQHEVEAILLGAKMVGGWGDEGLAASAKSAIQKILAVLPDHLRHSDDNFPLIVPHMEEVQQYFTAFSQPLRGAIHARQRIHIDYVRADEQASTRILEPLGLIFWGKVWTLVAWCHLRNDYRTFRLDRIKNLQLLEQHFEISGQKNLKHFIQLQKEACESRDQPFHQDQPLPETVE